MTFPKLDIIIVNWNSGLQLYNCLNSVEKADKFGLQLNQVVVVDNNSMDYSLETVERCKLPLAMIRNDQNRGFAAACNQGAKNSTADYLLFLNPDTILEYSTLQKTIDFMENIQNIKIGILGVQLKDAQGQVCRTCARFPTVKSFYGKILLLNRLFPRKFPSHFMIEWDHLDSRIVDQIMGAYFLIRRELFEQLNGFDERFFVYYEEVDLSLRAKKAGFESYFYAETGVFHKGGGTSDQVKDLRLYYSLKSRILYGFKHFNKHQAFLLFLETVCFEFFIRIFKSIVIFSANDFKECFKAYLRLWLNVLNLLSKMRKEK
jgi:N-acetylglucosaminyl-diphospho-decaprenol L-rhamnosyltransferase